MVSRSGIACFFCVQPRHDRREDCDIWLVTWRPGDREKEEGGVDGGVVDSEWEDLDAGELVAMTDVERKPWPCSSGEKLEVVGLGSH